MSKGWIAVDLDGTLAIYTHWTGVTNIGEPIVPMVERVKQWLREGREVRILTARIWDIPNQRVIPEAVQAIKDWCERHIGQALAVTCIKDNQMIELWDDRAVQVEPNTGEPVTYWQSRV